MVYLFKTVIFHGQLLVITNWYNLHFPMVFLWCSYGFPMVFPIKPSIYLWAKYPGYSKPPIYTWAVSTAFDKHAAGIHGGRRLDPGGLQKSTLEIPSGYVKYSY
jgi:hypothetical protein